MCEGFVEFNFGEVEVVVFALNDRRGFDPDAVVFYGGDQEVADCEVRKSVQVEGVRSIWIFLCGSNGVGGGSFPVIDRNGFSGEVIWIGGFLVGLDGQGFLDVVEPG